MIFPSDFPAPPTGSSALSDASKQFCNSSASTKCIPEAGLQAQIAQLKEKAHQSFMQVMQMQQLHDQELELLREEQAQREAELNLRIQELEERVASREDLELRVQQLENENSAMERNHKMFFCEIEDEELSIDGIDIIPAQQDTPDEDSITHLQEVLALYEKEEDFQQAKDQLLKQARIYLGNSSSENWSSGAREDSPLLQMAARVISYVSSLRVEWTKAIQNQRKIENQPPQETVGSKGIESLERESKFMAEHIKRLSVEKLRAEKRAVEAERQLRALQDKIAKIDVALDKRGIRLDELPKRKSPGLLDHDHSLDLDEFVSENLKNTCNAHPHPSLKAHHNLLARTHKR